MSKKKIELLKSYLNSNDLNDHNRDAFRRMYPNGPDVLKGKSLDHAISQCERSIKDNKESYAVAKTEFDKLNKETQALVLGKFPNLLTEIFDSHSKKELSNFLAELESQKTADAAQVKANQEKAERDKLTKISKDNQNPKFESFDSLEEAQDHYKDDGASLFDCGQGYYQDEVTTNAYIEDSLYSVKLTAEIDSSKQDRGDRLYWVEKVTNISFTPVSERSVIESEKAELFEAIANLESQLKLKKERLNSLNK